jgi:hypothetical protein
MSKVGFLGLGAMGSRMPANILKAGHTVTVWNRSPEAAEALVASGARRASSPKEAAEGGDFVFVMVRDDKASQNVWLDATNGALAGMRSGAVAIEPTSPSRYLVLWSLVARWDGDDAQIDASFVFNAERNQPKQSGPAQTVVAAQPKHDSTLVFPRNSKPRNEDRQYDKSNEHAQGSPHVLSVPCVAGSRPGLHLHSTPWHEPRARGWMS